MLYLIKKAGFGASISVMFNDYRQSIVNKIHSSQFGNTIYFTTEIYQNQKVH